LPAIWKTLHELLYLIVIKTQFVSQITTLIATRSDQRIDDGLVNFLWRLVGNLFNLHATFSGGHENDTACGTIHHRTQIQLLCDIRAGLYQNLTNGLAASIRLVGHQS
jgi:hypothetical protein